MWAIWKEKCHFCVGGKTVKIRGAAPTCCAIKAPTIINWSISDIRRRVKDEIVFCPNLEYKPFREKKEKTLILFFKPTLGNISSSIDLNFAWTFIQCNSPLWSEKKNLKFHWKWSSFHFLSECESISSLLKVFLNSHFPVPVQTQLLPRCTFLHHTFCGEK